jgi:hypothetical protein
LKEKIGKFIERKERNAEGKTFACQMTSFISAMFYKIFTKQVYISNVIIFKNEKVFSKMIFFSSKLKNIPKGVRSTKCPVAT